ncbi:hypothetical protein SERLADRAFT_432046 [Serpula lacrymans var. lacrymans S7.9]|uniref:DUF6532 domain-containing protein n=1 Tax=Serpula lacrymans var. lacrymans (strain S7.9) TaxID=578457 RepID=F8NEA3_SERL9|nr:uncharacterized protein SERLADRAFT_432046 [Serpula lacrymans var. lacrymans S7.9]EGO30485.1 hypothetical protein SERLADRAFT_432046 [Serpula lacrymans var. lacrymans S7.9]
MHQTPKEVLQFTIAVFRCLVRASLNLALTPDILKLIIKRTSHVQMELKTKVHGRAGTYYGFRASSSPKVIAQNCQLAMDMKENVLFVYKDLKAQKGLYKAGIIQIILDDMWFANCNDKGVAYHKYSNPVSLEIVALILTTVSAKSIGHHKGLALQACHFKAALQEYLANSAIEEEGEEGDVDDEEGFTVSREDDQVLE